MKIQFTHPYYLLLLPLALGWVIWLAWKSDVQISKWRRWLAFSIRAVIVTGLVLALAGLQLLRPMEGMNVFFLLDRSDSIPQAQQDAARAYVTKSTAEKKRVDKAGIIVFGSEANIETTANTAVEDAKVYAVVGKDRTDIAGAIRLGTAAFPETGQKRLVLMSDGNENMGDAMGAMLAARQLGVTMDVVPLGVTRGNDVSVQKLTVPPRLKKGQVFEAKIFIQVRPRAEGDGVFEPERQIHGQAGGGAVRRKKSVHVSADAVGAGILHLRRAGGCAGRHGAAEQPGERVHQRAGRAADPGGVLGPARRPAAGGRRCNRRGCR